jgi:hypothetical protein
MDDLDNVYILSRNFTLKDPINFNGNRHIEDYDETITCVKQYGPNHFVDNILDVHAPSH